MTKQLQADKRVLVSENKKKDALVSYYYHIIAEILVPVIKFGCLAPNAVLKSIGRFKFGGMVQYCSIYVHA